VVKRCGAMTRGGRACQMPPLTGALYCFAHSPECAEQRAIARRIGGHRRQQQERRAPSEMVSLRDPSAVLLLVEHVVADLGELENSTARARVLLYAANTAITALERGDLETRLAALEGRLEFGAERRI
jgi:hypothetical protein